jgi:hypothetical protein
MTSRLYRSTASSLLRASPMCLGLILASVSPASSDQPATLTDAIASAYNPAQISALIAVAAGWVETGADLHSQVIVADVAGPIDGHEATVAKPPAAAPPAIAHDEAAVTPERVVMALVQPTAMKPTAPPDRPKSAPEPITEAVAKLPPAVAILSTDMLQLLLRRGDAMLALGDLASARLLYARAASAGDARGAIGVAKTYDPSVLSQIGARGIKADSATAAVWYRKALERVVVTAPALTQPTVTPPTAPGSSVTADEHGPAASERVPSDSAGQPVWSKLRPHQGVQRRSPAAPRSATASVDENASADQYLRAAQTALRERRIREAREALERAEIRVLNSAPNTNAGKNSTVDTIEQAREALGHVRYLRPDLARGGQMIDQAMSETASKGTSSLSGGQSGSTNGTNGSAGPTPPSR